MKKYKTQKLNIDVNLFLSSFIALCIFAFPTTNANAAIASSYGIENLEGTNKVGDFLIGPGKQEVELNPGESKTFNVYVTNRTGEDKDFKVEIEDFKGSRDIQSPVVLLGQERGPYSLKDYIKIKDYGFTLKHGQRATIPVTITIPRDSEPGSKFGSVLVSTASRPALDENGKPVKQSSAIVSRIGSLIFVKVPGDTKKDGNLSSFDTLNGQRYFSSGPIKMNILFENNGNVYLNPYGRLTITNTLGSDVGKVDIDPWFSMPDSLRSREVSWDRELLFGRYAIHLSLNRGYDDKIDEAEIVIWVLPWKIMLSAFLVVIFLLAVFRWVMSNFEIKKKS